MANRRGDWRLTGSSQPGAWASDGQHMVLMIGALLSLTVVAILSGLRMRMNAELGWMSEQWLAEYRASHP